MSAPAEDRMPLIELGVAQAHHLLSVVLGQDDIPPLGAIENEDWGRDYVLARLASESDATLASLGLTRLDRDEHSAP